MTFIFPTVKAILTVTGFFIGLGWASYSAVVAIAEAQGEVIERKVMAVRNADFQHIDGRFNRTDEKLDKIMEAINKK
jgi:hypothetical protein